MPRFDPAALPPLPDLLHETALWRRGLPLVAGVDEAGRGALAGPVFAAAVILPANPQIAAALHGVNDSKKLTAAQREFWSTRLPTVALAAAVGSASHEEIDAYGIVPATRLAIRRALLALHPLPDHLLVDALPLPEVPIPQTILIKGDARSLSIAAAAILAKTARDQYMRALSGDHPGYYWAYNKGYGTAAHLHAIERLGPSPFHRRTFAPLNQFAAPEKA
jgi:ribonuclease HII